MTSRHCTLPHFQWEFPTAPAVHLRLLLEGSSMAFYSVQFVYCGWRGCLLPHWRTFRPPRATKRKGCRPPVRKRHVWRCHNLTSTKNNSCAGTIGQLEEQFVSLACAVMSTHKMSLFFAPHEFSKLHCWWTTIGWFGGISRRYRWSGNEVMVPGDRSHVHDASQRFILNLNSSLCFTNLFITDLNRLDGAPFEASSVQQDVYLRRNKRPGRSSSLRPSRKNEDETNNRR